ncbi:MAG: hypothetical protein A3F72_09805 [Bacteroidetes bacterium RIFCSPLOWO2_12_FULL_35_15]|nr:MAG: hypothetical protein A3F72_09805 [Bacteroidetes bacterium RIFCSPLOWO2_12_FULL_35_15]
MPLPTLLATPSFFYDSSFLFKKFLLKKIKNEFSNHSKKRATPKNHISGKCETNKTIKYETIKYEKSKYLALYGFLINTAFLHGKCFLTKENIFRSRWRCGSI